MTLVHLQLIRMTLSKLSVPWKERADYRQVTLIELMGGGALGRWRGKPGKMEMGESCIELGSVKGRAVFFNGGCRLKKAEVHVKVGADVSLCDTI